MFAGKSTVSTVYWSQVYTNWSIFGRRLWNHAEISSHSAIFHTRYNPSGILRCLSTVVDFCHGILPRSRFRGTWAFRFSKNHRAITLKLVKTFLTVVIEEESHLMQHPSALWFPGAIIIQKQEFNHLSILVFYNFLKSADWRATTHSENETKSPIWPNSRRLRVSIRY